MKPTGQFSDLDFSDQKWTPIRVACPTSPVPLLEGDFRVVRVYAEQQGGE